MAALRALRMSCSTCSAGVFFRRSPLGITLRAERRSDGRRKEGLPARLAELPPSVLLHHLQRKISPFADDTHTQVEGLDNDSDVSIVGGDTSGDTVG